MWFQEKGQQNLRVKICPNEWRTSKLIYVGKLNVLQWTRSKAVTLVCAGATENFESDSGLSYRLLSPSVKKFSPYVEIKSFKPYTVQGIEWKLNFRWKCPFLDYTSEEPNERLEEFTN